MTEFEKTIEKDQILAMLDDLKQAITCQETSSISLDELKIDLPKDFTCELEYEEKDNTAELELEFKWRTDQAYTPVNNSQKPSGSFELFQGKDAQWYFHLRAANHQIILVSQGYTAKESAKKGIASVKSHAQAEHFEHRLSTSKQPYFVLKAKNGEIIGCSQMYRRQGGCRKGIQSVIHHARNSEILEL